MFWVHTRVLGTLAYRGRRAPGSSVGDRVRETMYKEENLQISRRYTRGGWEASVWAEVYTAGFVGKRVHAISARAWYRACRRKTCGGVEIRLARVGAFFRKGNARATPTESAGAAATTGRGGRRGDPTREQRTRPARPRLSAVVIRRVRSSAGADSTPRRRSSLRKAGCRDAWAATFPISRAASASAARARWRWRCFSRSIAAEKAIVLMRSCVGCRGRCATALEAAGSGFWRV